MKKLVRNGIVFFTVLILMMGLMGCESPSVKEALSPETRPSLGTGSFTDPLVVQAVFGDQTLVATVRSIEAMKDYAVLTVDFSVPADSPSSAKLKLWSVMGSALYDDGPGGVRLVDFTTERVWGMWSRGQDDIA